MTHPRLAAAMSVAAFAAAGLGEGRRVEGSNAAAPGSLWSR
jgi:hypothetical protein